MSNDVRLTEVHGSGATRRGSLTSRTWRDLVLIFDRLHGEPAGTSHAHSFEKSFFSLFFTSQISMAEGIDGPKQAMANKLQRLQLRLAMAAERIGNQISILQHSLDDIKRINAELTGFGTLLQTVCIGRKKEEEAN